MALALRGVTMVAEMGVGSGGEGGNEGVILALLQWKLVVSNGNYLASEVEGGVHALSGEGGADRSHGMKEVDEDECVNGTGCVHR